MKIFKTRNNGFTLIELLVVVLIIVILSLISIFALNGQRIKARDAQRLNDIRQIRTALEIYQSNEGEYPVMAESVRLGSLGMNKLCSKLLGGFVTADIECSPDSIYMSKIPSDPEDNKNYTYTGSLDGFDIKFGTEKETNLGPAGVYHAHSEGFDRQVGNK